MLGRTLLIAALISLVFAAHVWAKGITVEIVIRGSELAQPSAANGRRRCHVKSLHVQLTRVLVEIAVAVVAGCRRSRQG